ncbi:MULTISPECIES: peroxiredoxin [Acetobacteraceae]|uniref:thioredoxin-dependent peroxiredoxin n=1 Tax=Bombella apis TaxID=1785988 RepID=A0ABR9MLT0_9PROT|nr:MULTISPECIES: peroxiredoxin [Acetobacteraceae]MBE1722825.1 peroxiredoxin [Bombella apis]MBR9730630.1 peroxiredoxin [Bombella apis]MCL1512927.1 peroxiredoxin [Parasaccharibacter sp. TMW 2.1891]MCT6813570.1 peroxiredoxin [Bombella apis]
MTQAEKVSGSGEGLAVGAPVPDFDLAGMGPTGEERVSSHALRGQPYLLYFYPRASTPGCTTQACDLRDHLAELRIPGGDGLRVLGVSPDGVGALEKFILKQALSFTLLSDPDHALAEAYGVWVKKKLYGREFMGIERSSFLVDAEGRLVAFKRKVSPARHVAWVQEALSRL